MNLRQSLLSALFALTILVGSYASASPQILVGVITDDMCGRKHTMMSGKPDSDCIRACVKAGAHYALLAGDKVYVLKGDAKQFEQLAGKKVQVSGNVTGTTVAVSSMTPAR
jgi:hypothetical protein